jgi:hypothetical protein
MRFLGWTQWHANFATVWVRPGVENPKRSEVKKILSLIQGAPERTADRPPKKRVAWRPGPHLLDLDRREASLKERMAREAD